MRRSRLSATAATALVVGLIAALLGLVGVNPAQAAEVQVGGEYTPRPPTRILDTRDNGYGNIPCVTTEGHVLQVGGDLVLKSDNGGAPAAGNVIPVGHNSVVLNVTAVDANAPGWVTVWPGGPQPTASSLNYVATTAVTNQVIARLDETGKVKIASSAGCPQIVVDVLGSFKAVPVNADPDTFRPVPGGFKATNPVTQPPRVMDTRLGSDPNAGCLATGGTKELDLTNAGGIPGSNVKAAALNVTVVNPTAQGWVTVFPKGQAEPNASNLNYVANQTVPNSVVIKLGTSDRVVFAAHGGCPHLVVDVVGWFQSGDAGVGAFEGLNPKRLADTRPNAVGVEPGGPTGGCVSVERKVKVAGRGGVPGIDAAKPPSAVAVNVTATDAQGAGFLTVWPTGSPKPFTSALNYKAGANATPNMVISQVGPDGEISVFADQGCPHVLVDVVGYFVGTEAELTVTTPAPIVFTNLGAASKDLEVTVKNNSLTYNEPGPIGFSAGGIDGAEFTKVAGGTCGTGGIPAGGSCSVMVRWAPVGADNATGTIKLTGALDATPDVVVAGTYTPPAP